MRRSEEDHKHRELWRIIVGILSIVYIVFMWIKKDIVSVYATMPQEQFIPLIVTTVAVSLIKIAVIAGGIFLVKWLICKSNKR